MASSGGEIVKNNTSGAGGWAEGFYYSILFMLAVPFTLAAGLSGLLYVGMRNAPKRPISTPTPPG